MSEADPATTLPTQDRAAREALVRKAVRASNSNALRLALYQATHDPELIGLELAETPVRGGAQFQRVVAESAMPMLEDKAVAYLLDPPPEKPAPPSEAEARKLLELFTGAPIADNYARFGLEEVAFDEFPRDVQWTNKPSPEALAKIQVIVVGGGISGVAAAIQMKRLGLPTRVIERQADLGGTWYLNDYPEARVDTSSYMYQFKFEKNYPWSEFFAARAETRDYLRYIADKYGVYDDFQFSTSVTAAIWDADAAVWHVTLKRADDTEEHVDANFIITGSGLFSTPNLKPDIPGIDSFKGAMFHTTQWDHGFDIADKRIALIGTGSTGVQLMPALARAASQLTVYQRTANWLASTPGYRDKVPPEIRVLFDDLPYYWNWYCYASFDTSVQLQNAQTYDHEWRKNNEGVSQANELLRKALLGYIGGKLEGRPDLIEKVTPNHPPLARRLVVDNGFYDALLQPNVDLVNCGIERITPEGIVSTDGVERPFDLIVLSAGFKVSKYLFPVDYRGRDGITLDQAWAKDGARSFLGMAMPGFPNLFMLYGPNGQPRSGGFYSWAEIWARYAGDAIVKLIENSGRAMEVKQSVFDNYNARLDEADKEILWAKEGENGYFVNEFGRSSVNIAFRTEDYHAMVREADLSDYIIAK